ncbi:MAG: hypothetical protein BWY97_00056 [Tenericutes bacterium ADurb.BinA124]|nr:MAG: hypothetical protein BWY97_00056 [Tenericutes bacterium ADurb.BinA124]
MKTFENDLTSRQYDLYEYLKEQETYKHLSEIIAETGMYGNDTETHNSKGSRALRKDLRALKSSGIIQTTIISNTKKGVKIATKVEYQTHAKRKWNAIIRTINLQKLQDTKAGLDQQLRLVFNQEKGIIEAFKNPEVNA